MTDLIFHVLSWPTLLIALLVFGFAPGAVLRLIVLAYEREDPRRQELLGELYHVPRIERPFWMAKQLELAVAEGLGQRLAWAATGRIIHRWHLGSGVERNLAHPDTFQIPGEQDRLAVVPGMDAKLMFEMKDGFGERMWVTVTEVKKRHLVGMLCNLPVGIPRLVPGDKIKFKHEHIIDIWCGDDEKDGDDQDGGTYHLTHDCCHRAGAHPDSPDNADAEPAEHDEP